MKQILFTLAKDLFVSLLLLTAITGCTSSQAQSGKIKRIDNTELRLLLDSQEIQLVDVRTPNEYRQGHLKESQLIDFMQPDFAEKVALLDRDKPIVVYCAVGGRSHQSTQELLKMGFKEIYDLKRGIKGWTAEGLPIEK